MKTADRVKDTASPGSGSVTVSGTPPTQFQAFSVFSVGDTIYYGIFQQGGSALWEVGQGTMTSSTNFTRDVVYDGSSGPGSTVTFTSTCDIICDMPSYAVKRGRWGLSLAQNYNWMLP